MAESRNSAVATTEELARLLRRLEEVLAEAGRLREEVARQLADQRRRQQPRVTGLRTPPTRKRR